MHDVHAEASHLQIIFHDDNETPLQFVVELLHSVFNKQFIDAVRFTEAIGKDGKASCGNYPREIAADLLETARQRVRAAGHPRPKNLSVLAPLRDSPYVTRTEGTRVLNADEAVIASRVASLALRASMSLSAL